MEKPAYLQNRVGRDLNFEALQGLSQGAPPRISTRGDRFRLLDASGSEELVGDTLEGVIVDLNPAVTKQYYEGPWDPKADDNKPPTCSSDDGVRPLPNSPKVQSELCMTCPHNVWGSKINASGKPGKVCSDRKRLAFLPDGKEFAFLLQVPPASLKGFGKFVQVATGNNASVNELQTRLTIEDKELRFTAIRWVSEEQSNFIRKLDHERTGALVGRLASSPTAQQIEGPKEEPKALFQPTGLQQAVHNTEQRRHEHNGVVGHQAGSFLSEQAAQQQATNDDKPKRVRRTKAEIEAAREQSLKDSAAIRGEPQETDEQREFREWQESKRKAQAASEALSAKNNAPSFGMQEPEKIDDDAFSKALDDALKLDTGDVPF